MEASVAKGFKVQDGPFVKTLDTALASFNVHRQAYYSGTFVGNDVHRTLKVRQFVMVLYLQAVSYLPFRRRILSGCANRLWFLPDDFLHQSIKQLNK